MLKDPPTIIVPLGRGKFSSDKHAVLKTFALGSCIGLSFYDPSRQLGGLFHIALPDSSTDPKKAKILPYYFIDSALASITRITEKHKISLHFCEIKAAGGATLSSLLKGTTTRTTGHYDIGNRNIEVLKNTLIDYNLKLKGSHLGGNFSRNMSLNLSTGKVTVYNTQNQWEL